MKLNITKQAGGYNINIEKPCCDDMSIALQKQFVVFFQHQPNKPPVIVFKAPGEMVRFQFCPWCRERIESKKRVDLVVPGVDAPVDLKVSRAGR